MVESPSVKDEATSGRKAVHHSHVTSAVGQLAHAYDDLTPITCFQQHRNTAGFAIKSLLCTDGVRTQTRATDKPLPQSLYFRVFLASIACHPANCLSLSLAPIHSLIEPPSLSYLFQNPSIFRAFPFNVWGKALCRCQRKPNRALSLAWCRLQASVSLAEVVLSQYGDVESEQIKR